MQKFILRYTTTFADVIQAIENRDNAKLHQFRDAGILTSITDSSRNSVLLYYVTQLSSSSNDASLIQSHIDYFAQQCPNETWKMFESCALELTKTEKYETLKLVISSYGYIKFHLQQRALIELRKLYRNIFSLIINFKMEDEFPSQNITEDNEYYVVVTDEDSEEIETKRSILRPKLKSTQVITSLLEWAHLNAFPWAFQVWNWALFESYDSHNEAFISKTIFSFLNNACLKQHHENISHLYEKFYIFAASNGDCSLLVWLNQFRNIIETERFQLLLKSALTETSGSETKLQKMLINDIIQFELENLNLIFSNTIISTYNYILSKDSNAANETFILDNPETIAHEVTSIVLLLEVAKKEKIIKEVLGSAIKKLKNSELKLLLVALSLHYTQRSASSELCLIDLQNLSLSDDQFDYLLSTIYNIYNNGKLFNINKPCIPKKLNISNNTSIGNYTMATLAKWSEIRHFTSIDLSFNPQLGCNTKRHSPLQTFLKSLSGNTTIHLLNLKDTNFGNSDFSVLAKLLETDSTLIDIDLSNNPYLTSASEVKLMELLLIRNKRGIPALCMNLEGTELGNSHAQHFLIDAKSKSQLVKPQASLIEQLKTHLKAEIGLAKRACQLNCIVLTATQLSLSDLNLAHLSLTDHEGYLLLHQLHEYSHLPAQTVSEPDDTLQKNDLPLRKEINLSLRNNLLAYHSGTALSALCNSSHLSVIDLSNNPHLGREKMHYWGSSMYNSGVQLLAKSLINNATLKTLILASCGVNDDDFVILINMLKINSVLRKLDLTRNETVTTATVESALPTLNEHRFRHQYKALRPKLDTIITKKENSPLTVIPNGSCTQTDFHRNIHPHIEQLRLHSLGAQINLKNAPDNHGSAWDQISHFLHTLVLVTSTAGIILGVVEIFKTMKLAYTTFKHGFHNIEEIIKVFEHLHLGTKGLEILLHHITDIRKKGAALSDKFYYRYNKYGLTETMTRTLVNFVDSLYALLASDHHNNNLTVFFEKFDKLAVFLDIDKTAAELSHNFSDCERIVNDSFEVKLQTDIIAEYFKRFCDDKHIKIDWPCVAQQFSHWILAAEPHSSEIVNLKQKSPIDEKGKEEAYASHTDSREERPEWVEDVIRHRGFRCYGNNNEIISFNLSYKIISGDKKPQTWLTTDGDRFGYYPIGWKFLREIQEKINGYKKDNPEGRIIRIDSVHIEYEISEHEMERLSQQTLKPILSGYQPTEEQLRNIQAAISDLREKVEALRVKTDENTKEIVVIKQRLDDHDVKHQDTVKKFLRFEERDQPTAASQEESTEKDIKIALLKKEIDDKGRVIDSQGIRINVLEGEVGALKEVNADLTEANGTLRMDVDTLKVTVAVLTDRLDRGIVVAHNAAQNADLAADRVERQVPPAEDQQQHGNNNQDEGGPENRREIPVNPPIEPDNPNATAANSLN